jgi:hypothetical protein
MPPKILGTTPENMNKNYVNWGPVNKKIMLFFLLSLNRIIIIKNGNAFGLPGQNFTRD